MQNYSAIGRLAAMVIIAAGAAQAQDEEQQVRQIDAHPVVATAIQTLSVFDNAESAIFSADGAYVFVGNAAEIGDRAENFGWTEGEGYISKLAVTESGQLEMVAERLIDASIP